VITTEAMVAKCEEERRRGAHACGGAAWRHGGMDF